MTIIVLSFLGVLFGTPDVRTDYVETSVNLVALSHHILSENCSVDEESVGCATGDQVIGYGYENAEEATDIKDVRVQFLSWKNIGKKCGRLMGGPACYEDNVIYVYEYGIYSTENISYLGKALVEALGIQEGGPVSVDDLGRKFMRHIGDPEPATFVWQEPVRR